MGPAYPSWAQSSWLPGKAVTVALRLSSQSGCVVAFEWVILVGSCSEASLPIERQGWFLDQTEHSWLVAGSLWVVSRQVVSDIDFA